MLEYKFTLDDLEISKKYKKLIAKNPMLCRDILSFLSEAVVNRTVIHNLSGQILKRKTGTLAKSVNYKMINDYSSKVGTNIIYGAIHEYGGIIKPKVADFLRFKIKDQWITTKQVNMPARHWLSSALDYVLLNEAQDILNKRINVFLKKEWQE